MVMTTVGTRLGESERGETSPPGGSTRAAVGNEGGPVAPEQSMGVIALKPGRDPRLFLLFHAGVVQAAENRVVLAIVADLDPPERTPEL